jgi:type IV pilus assembly protein PilA
MKKLTTLLKKKDRGFTLIELIVVIGILAILAALAIPAVAGYLENSKAQTNMATAKTIYNAASAYLAANPDETTVDITKLVTDKYLANKPKTATGSDTFEVTVTAGQPSVKWTKSTTLPTEVSPYPAS